MKPTKKELALRDARDLFASPPTDTAAQAEAAKLMQERFRLTRAEIGNVLGITTRQVLTRLAEYKNYAAKGLIPTGNIPLGLLEEPAEEVKEDFLESQSRTEINRETKELVKIDVVLDRIAEKVAGTLPSKNELRRIDEAFRLAKKQRRRIKGDEEGVSATVSDWHLGLVNEYYNLDTARDILNRFVGKIIRLTDLHRMQCPVRRVYLNLIGDNIQGSYANFSSQRWTTTLASVDQTQMLVEAMVGVIENLLVEFDEVEVSGCHGNHGYILPGKTTTEPDQANYETIAHRTLQWAFRHNKRVKFNLLEGRWYQIVNMYGYRLAMLHGHTIPGAGSFDGIQSAVRKLNMPDYDGMIMGHFHRAGRIPLPMFFGSRVPRTLYLNGTAIIGDDHSERFGSAHTQEWWIKFLGNGRVTAEYPVPLYAR